MGRDLKSVTPSALDWFLRYPYPGNVRELENLVERAIALETTDVLTAVNLPPMRRRTTAAIAVSGPELTDNGLDLDAAIADVERRLIKEALGKTRGVRKEAAKLLSISFRSLRYRLEKLGIEVSRSRGGSEDGL